MTLIAKNDGGDFTPAPAGNHVAICYAVLDLGTQHSDAFTWEGSNIPAADRPQILIMWELPNELVEIEGEMQPAVTSHFYNMFFNDKARLRKDLESWRGRQFSQEELQGFDISKLLGVPCMLNIVHNDKGKAKITGVASMPKGLEVSKPTNDLLMFTLDNYDQAVFDSISEGIQNIIKRSPEWQALNQPKQGFRQTENPNPYEEAGPDVGDGENIPF